MRTIKFRAWDKVVKEMVDDFDIEASTGIPVKNDVQTDTRNLILMQHIGFKDSKGKEIYEGDWVVETFKEYWEKDNIPDDLAGQLKSEDVFEGQVVFDEDTCSFIIDSDEHGKIVLISDSDNIEIIGNIYENKDLLK